MRNCGVTKALCAGVVAGTRYITPKIVTTLTTTFSIIRHRRSILVNDNTTEYNVSQEKETITKLSAMALQA